MLYMLMIRWAPDKRDEVFARNEKLKNWNPKGFKELGSWGCMTGGLVFQLVNLPENNPAAILAGTLAWSDLCHIEAFPVMDSTDSAGLMGEAMKLLPKK